jgi:hypothetical protein
MTQYIEKSAVVAEIDKRLNQLTDAAFDSMIGRNLIEIRDSLDTFEVKEVNEVPATVMVNKYGNRFISSWSGLKEYDDLKEGEEIKILIPKK